MNYRNSWLYLVLFITLFSCKSLEPEVLNAIAGCSGGISEELKTQITAEYEKTSGDVTASLVSNLQGIFLSNPNFTGEQALEAHRQYMDCYNRYVPTAEQKYNSILEDQVNDCEARLACDASAITALRNCVVSGGNYVSQYSSSEKDQKFAEWYNRACVPIIEGIPDCWYENNEDLNLQRSRCKLTLNQVGREVPLASTPDNYDRISKEYTNF